MKRRYLISVAGIIIITTTVTYAAGPLLIEAGKCIIEIIVSGLGWDAMKGLGGAVTEAFEEIDTETQAGYTTEGHKVVYVARAPKTVKLEGQGTDKTFRYDCSGWATLHHMIAPGEFEKDGHPCSPLSLTWNADGCTGQGSPFTVSGTSSSERTIMNICNAEFRGARTQLAPTTRLVFAAAAPPLEPKPCQPFDGLGSGLRGWM